LSAHDRIVVTGAGGQVGRALTPLLPEASFLTRDALDVADDASVISALAEARMVVHLAAMTNVDGCESDPQRARAINARGTRHVAAAARETGARVIYVSTDYVFDGLKDKEYEVDDEPNPINEYGRGKRDGEKSVASDPGNLIVRTSSVFGDGRNFVKTIIAAARAGRDLRVVDDQVSRPTAAVDIARAIAYLVNGSAHGIVHVAGAGPPCSWAELAERALRAAGLNSSVGRVDSASYAAAAGRLIAPRPSNSVLSLAAARDLGVPLADWRESLKSYVKESGL
jgi:dTDP-4-dehydrorhamnose reductase